MMQHSIMLNPKTETKNTLEILPGRIPKYIVLRQTASENGAISRISYEGRDVTPEPKVDGGLTIYPLPETDDATRTRELLLTWNSKTKRQRQVTFEVTDAPISDGPATVRSVPLATRKPNEIDEAIAQSVGCDPMKFASIVTRIAEKHRITPESMLEFFGADGMSTVEGEWVANVKNRAKELGVPAGELIAASIMTGVAKTLAERKEFEELMKDRTKGESVGLPDDFGPVVSSMVETEPNAATEDSSPQAHDTEPPTSIETPTGGTLLEVAKLLQVEPSWLKSAVQIITQLREVSPNATLVGVHSLITSDLAKATSLLEQKGNPSDWDDMQRASAIIDIVAASLANDHRA